MEEYIEQHGLVVHRDTILSVASLLLNDGLEWFIYSMHKYEDGKDTIEPISTLDPGWHLSSLPLTWFLSFNSSRISV
jgi:hypothetical protein